MADYVVSQGFDVLALTETWLGKDTDQLVVNELFQGGYELEHVQVWTVLR